MGMAHWWRRIPFAEETSLSVKQRAADFFFLSLLYNLCFFMLLKDTLLHRPLSTGTYVRIMKMQPGGGGGGGSVSIGGMPP